MRQVSYIWDKYGIVSQDMPQLAFILGREHCEPMIELFQSFEKDTPMIRVVFLDHGAIGTES
jgi:hypothetical protein